LKLEPFGYFTNSATSVTKSCGERDSEGAGEREREERERGVRARERERERES
jgi:hypothetical protein